MLYAKSGVRKLAFCHFTGRYVWDYFLPGSRDFLECCDCVLARNPGENPESYSAIGHKQASCITPCKKLF